MPSSPTTAANFSTPPSPAQEQEEALALWACPRWAKTRGASLRLGKKLTLGGTGDFRLSNFGLGLASSLGVEAIVQAASEGSRSIGTLGGGAVMVVGSKLAAALSGSSAAWRRSKSRGDGNLGAFSALSRRCAHSLIGHLTPNVLSLAYLGTAIPALGAALIAGISPKTGPLAKIGSLSLASAVSLSGAMDRLNRRAQTLDDWKFSHLCSSALLDGGLLLADEIYSQLAMMRANSRWHAATDANIPTPISPTERLSATENKFLSRLKSLVSTVKNNGENLSRCLEIIRAAEIPPWHRPAPGMPDLTDLAQATLAYQKPSPDDVHERILASLAGMAARREAHQLESSLPMSSESTAPRRPASRL